MPLEKSPTALLLQAITVALLSAGGYLGKGAYEEIRAELVAQRIVTAEMGKTIEAWGMRMRDTSQDIGQLKAKMSELEMRVTRLEVKAEARDRR